MVTMSGNSTALKQLSRYVLAVAGGWTIIIGIMLAWNYQVIQHEMLAQARKEAGGSLRKDLLYRSWIRQQGGIYVAVTDEILPNPYLAHVPERDITTPSGRLLTLMNSSYVGSQIQRLSTNSEQLAGHNTSLKPLNPKNAPDPWEERALRKFESGTREVAGVEQIDGKPYLRLILPVEVEATCLKCHRHQGYKVGDIRGGISVSVPLASYLVMSRSQMLNRFVGHGIIWLVGMTGLWAARSRMRRGILETSAAESALKESDARNRAIVEHIPDIIFRMGKDGTFLDCQVSRSHLLLMPQEEFLGKRAADVLPPALAEQVAQNMALAIASDEVQIFDYQLTFVERQCHFEGRMVAIGSGDVLIIIRDITERVLAEQERLELERRLLHSQKLESLGILAGGIAHDFNNLLMIIRGNLELALKGIDPATPTRERIDSAMKATHRSAELTRQMLAYSGKGKFRVSMVDLGDLVEENIHLLKSSIPKNVALNLNLLRPISAIKADAAQIHQVVMNLITNAWESCGEKQGVISITTGEGAFDARYLSQSRIQVAPAAGRFIYLDVDDTGCGMDSETQRCLFDPFFTTKFTGRGLGMSAILGIIKGHSGAIIVDSEPGKGSIIRVLFPVPVDMPVTDMPEQVVCSAAAGTGITKTILVVDDEEQVRDVCKGMVELLGYNTITASDGVEAVELFRQHVAEIGCVILDLSMPNMNGLAAFREMMEVRSDARILLSSGFCEEDATRQFVGEGLTGFLQKPYELEKLQESLHRVFAGGVHASDDPEQAD